MARLEIRWSVHESVKPYARPFAVRFLEDEGDVFGAVAVTGADLLYFRQFQAAVLTLTGELYRDLRVADADDPQMAWLDVLSDLLPALPHLRAQPVSGFDDSAGRVFRCRLDGVGLAGATISAASLLDYQEFQAAVAHQTGYLYRNPDVEAVVEPGARHALWFDAVNEFLARPDPTEVMATTWPWR